MSTTGDGRGAVTIAINLGGLHPDVFFPAIGSWTETRTAEGWLLDARLDRREFAALSAALRFSPMTARVDGDRAALSLRVGGWPGASSVTIRFDASLLPGA